ncbi:hypothetical protein SFRURICE_003031 [Spodoptera frugiperda]|nr:hypothetical protein SFRURICE_003031 [Spodoptera frugiperda]
MYLLVLFVLLGVVYAYCWWKPRSPPTYPGQLPLIGHSYILFKHRNDIWVYFSKVVEYISENGGFFQFRVGPHTIYVVDDPESVGIIANACLDKPYFYSFLYDGLGNGLITLNGEMWKIHHKLLNPAFSQHVLNTYLNEMDAQAQNLVSQLTTVAEKGPVNITEFLIQYVLRTICPSFDTTSAVIQNVLLVLGSHPEIQERVYNEIQDVLKNRDRLTKHDITKLVYLDAVIKEVLRVYNIVPLIARKIDTDIVLPKYTLRAGSSCIMSIYGLHRHSSWGPDAKQFKPERWLNPATLPTNPNVYAAFGIGKRMCIGKQYSMMSMKTSLVHILRKFRVSADMNIWGYFKSVGDYVSENGGIFQVRMGPHIMYVVDDPESVGIIANACLDKPYFYSFLYDGLGNGLITLNGEMWKIHHKLLNSAFSQHVLNTYLNEMDAQAQNLVSQLTTVAEKGPVNITEFLIQYVLRTICRTSLRLEAKDQDMIDNEYAKAIEEIEAILVRRLLNPILHFSFLFDRTAMYKRQLKLSQNNKKLLDPIIQKRKSDLIATKRTVNDNDDSVPGKFKPALDLLLNLPDEKYVLSDEEIMAHLNTFVAASFDTTSAVIQNVLLVLGSHPEIQERVYNEIQDVLKNRDRLTKHDITKLVYLDAVIKEVLRVYNIVPLIARKIDTDIVLPKYTLRAGSSCIMSICLHRHSSWGPDAKQFKPERWLNPATLPTNPNVYAAFGIGKRMCIGKQYSMMSMKTSLVQFYESFVFLLI